MDPFFYIAIEFLLMLNGTKKIKSSIYNLT